MKVTIIALCMCLTMCSSAYAWSWPELSKKVEKSEERRDLERASVNWSDVQMIRVEIKDEEKPKPISGVDID